MKDTRLVLFTAIGLLAASISYYFLMLFLMIPADNKAMIDAGMTYMRDIGMLLIGFYWGTSKGSGDKNETIKQLVSAAKEDSNVEKKV